MDSAASLKPKVTVKLNHDKPNGTTPLRAYGIAIHSRPPSPVKSYVSSSPQALKNIENAAQGNDGGAAVFRPKAKVNSSATARRPGTAGSTVGSTRPSSPTKLVAPRVRATISSNAPSRPVSSVTVSGTRTPRAPPTSSAPVTPQVRTRGLQVPSNNDDASPTHPNPPAGLHHAASMVSFSTMRAGSVVGDSSTVNSNAPHRLLGSRSVVGLTDRERTLTSSPTLKIRSKVTTMSKANTEPGSATAGSSSNPTSPVHAPVRSSTPNSTVNLRARAPSTVSLTPKSPPPHATSTASADSTSIPPNGTFRARAPSTVSQNPTSPPPQFYPITTAVSAANPHRFASARPPAATPPHSPPLPSNSTAASRASPTLGVQPLYQSFSSMPSNRVTSTNRTPNVKNLAARVDPATIPLPPHSPPASSVSFSSRSSASHLEPPSRGGHSRTGSASTSGGSWNAQGPNSGRTDLRETLDNLIRFTSGTASEDEGSGPEDGTAEGGSRGVGEEYKVKAAAKSDRKMADLEITNRSLLAINASLEATKHRQAKEIHELRRRLREARLILPPRAFRASKDSTLSTYTDADLGLDASSSSSDDEEHENDNENDESKEKSESDASYRRIKLLLDALLKQGTAALEHDKDALGTRGGVAKVLSPEEVRDYHAGGEEDHEDGTPENGSADASDDHDHEFDEDAGDDTREDVSEDDIPLEAETSFDSMDDDDPSLDAGNTTLTSEDEVEAMTMIGSPPILITKPS